MADQPAPKCFEVDNGNGNFMGTYPTYEVDQFYATVGIAGELYIRRRSGSRIGDIVSIFAPGRWRRVSGLSPEP